MFIKPLSFRLALPDLCLIPNPILWLPAGGFGIVPVAVNAVLLVVAATVASGYEFVINSVIGLPGVTKDQHTEKLTG